MLPTSTTTNARRFTCILNAPDNQEHNIQSPLCRCGAGGAKSHITRATGYGGGRIHTHLSLASEPKHFDTMIPPPTI